MFDHLRGAQVLITGASGFIGRHLTNTLSGIADVTVMLRPGQTALVPVVHATLENTDSLRAAVARVRPDVIFHLAAFANPARDPALTETMIAQNLTATVTLATAAADARFVFTGTCEEYGHQTPPFAETLTPAPLSPYSASKAAATTWLKMMHQTQGLDAVILRPFLVYGPGQLPPKLIPSACQAALAGNDFEMTSGQQQRELTYVGDVVDGLIRAATTKEASGQIINLGSGSGHKIIDLVHMVFDLAQSSGTPLPGALPDRSSDMQFFSADTNRARDILGWQVQTPLSDGLTQTLDWMRENGQRPIPL